MHTKLPNPKPAKREIELDFIRGIAILMVLDFHALRPILLAPFLWLGFPHFGWAGVDIFFVLSGFLVGGLLVKEWKNRGRIDTKRFLIRRGFKIWPQYYVFLLAMLLTRYRTLAQLWGNLLNIQNYVGGVAHTWTLAVEEHAYLLLVVALAFAARHRIRMRSLFLSIAGTCLLIVAWRFILSAHAVNTFARTDTRIDGILYGLLLAMLYHYAPERFRALQKLRWVWISIIVVTLAFFRFAPSQWWVVASTSWFLADLTGVAVLMLLYRHREGKERPFAYRLLAWIGLYSYGIYLWHVSVIAPIASLAHRLPMWAGNMVETIAPCLVGIAAGVIATKAVEFPALKLRDRLFPRRVDSAVGVP